MYLVCFLAVAICQVPPAAQPDLRAQPLELPGAGNPVKPIASDHAQRTWNSKANLKAEKSSLGGGSRAASLANSEKTLQLPFLGIGEDPFVASGSAIGSRVHDEIRAVAVRGLVTYNPFPYRWKSTGL